MLSRLQLSISNSLGSPVTVNCFQSIAVSVNLSCGCFVWQCCRRSPVIKDGVNLKGLSRTISYILRHSPETFGVRLDADGWADIEDLLCGIRREQPALRHLRASHVRQMIEYSRSFRYECADGRIRALYGHTSAQEPKRIPEPPPKTLYHGSDEVAARMILEEGLKPLARSHVHLTEDRRYAMRARHSKSGRPVILIVESGKAFEVGIKFYRARFHIWVADPIPAQFIRLESEVVA
jgi:putative RNA 2'-phosphotransferase